MVSVVVGPWSLVWKLGEEVHAPLDLGPPARLHCTLEDLEKVFYIVTLCHLQEAPAK